MHNYDELCQLRDKLTDELIEQGKKDGTLTNLDTLAHTIKNINKIIECEEKDGYSSRPYYYNPNTIGWSGNMGYYDDGYSMARGRGPRASRDSMGRYSSHEGDLMSELYSLMGRAQNDAERHQIQDLINHMQK